MTRPGFQPEPSLRPRVRLFDSALLEQVAAPAPAEPRPRRRIIQSVDDATGDLRQNVQDAARAVVAWVAAVTDHGDPASTDHDNHDRHAAPQPASLDRVLSDCLRPGPDVQALNYHALAQHINRTLHTELSAKRVRSAVAHLRRARQRRESPVTSLQRQLDALLAHLRAQSQLLLASGDDPQQLALRREAGMEILGAVRAAAGRVIDHSFGEHIPRQVDVDALEKQFLQFVRDAVREGAPFGGAPGALDHDLQRLLLTLGDYAGSAECDMRLVVHGARVVAVLLGPDSLPGLMAQLNVLVAGRQLLDSELYVAELLRLGEQAAALHDDAATRTLLNWVRRRPEDQRLPTPLRVASYCRNNAATHLLERVYLGTATDAAVALQTGQRCVTLMQQRDSGFALLPVTQLIALMAQAKVDDNFAPVQQHIHALGRDAALKLLTDLAKYDNCQPLVRQAFELAAVALPELRHQLIHLP